jgi:hypothetical protein
MLISKIEVMELLHIKSRYPLPLRTRQVLSSTSKDASYILCAKTCNRMDRKAEFYCYIAIAVTYVYWAVDVE